MVTNAARRQKGKMARAKKAVDNIAKKPAHKPKPVVKTEEDLPPQGPPPWIDEVILTTATSAEIGKVIYVRPELVRRDIGQPRQEFDKTLLQGLAKSIWEDGQEEPAHVYVEFGADGCQFTLKNGERRWRACLILEMPLMAIVKAAPRSAKNNFLGQIISNESQEKLSPVDEARAIKKALELGATMKEVARVFNKSEAWCYQRVKLLELSSDILKLMSLERPEKSRLGPAAALELLRAPYHSRYQMALDGIGQTIAKTRRAVRSHLGIGQRQSDLVRPRRPSDDRVLLEAFIDGVANTANEYQEFRNEILEGMFVNLQSGKHEIFLAKLERARNNMDALFRKLGGLKVFNGRK